MRILVVEDEQRLAGAIASGLGAEGFSVDVAHDGLDGLWRAREGQYGAIVLDILLPGMNGYEICANLRAEQVWTPILMLTAISEEEIFREPGDDAGLRYGISEGLKERFLPHRKLVIERFLAGGEVPAGTEGGDGTLGGLGPAD